MLAAILKVTGCFLIFPIIILLIYRRFSTYFKKLNKIPGPPGHLIVGHLFKALKSQESIFATDRARGSNYYPIYSVSVLHFGVVCPLSPEDIEIILSNKTHSKKSQIYKLIEPWLGTGLLTSYGDKWQMRRKMLTPAFHFTILQEFIQVFNKCGDKLVQDFTEQSSENPVVNVIPLISDMTLSAIAETSMGSKFDPKSESGREYRDCIHLLGKLATARIGRIWTHDNFIYSLTKSGQIYMKTVEKLHSITKQVINRRKTQNFTDNRKRQAMLDLLLTHQSSGDENIDDEGIREEVDTFMFEGHDTTSVGLSFILFALANNPEIQEEVYKEIVEVFGQNIENPTFNDLQELNYTERCIKESLRLYPSVPFIARENTEDIETATGYTIPKGTSIHVHIFDIHRSEKLYPDPKKFDPDRFLPANVKSRHPFAYIPFSAGPRNCIGQRFAQLELKVALCKILTKFKLEAVDKSEDIVFLSDFVLRTKDGLRVKLVPRN